MIIEEREDAGSDEDEEEKDDNPYINYVQPRSNSHANLGSALKNGNMLEYDDPQLKGIRNERQNELLAYQSFHQGSFFVNGENEKDEDNRVFNETSKEQETRIRRESPFGNLHTWKLLRIIVKSNDDVRQEQFAM